MPGSHDYIELETASHPDEADDLDMSPLERGKHNVPEPRHSSEATEHDYFLQDNAPNKEKCRFQKGKDFAWQALPSLIISVFGLIIAGFIMDEFQHWDVFTETSELFILLPILLNLKGNLEMNLAARLSTSANLGELDYGPTRRSLVVGNLALLQVQALVAGALAGIASFALGLVTKPGRPTSFYESMYMTSSSMVSASVSSAILGLFMCALVILSRRFHIDPDNIACPLASATGDIVTLVVLAACAYILRGHMDSLFSTAVFLAMSAMLPLFGFIVWKNKHVNHLLFSGWTPIICAMIISSLAGIVLEEYVEEFKGVALLTPVLIGLAGNLGSIYASRISTCLHSKTKEDYQLVEWTLMIMNFPVQLVFLLLIWRFNMGQLDYNGWFFLTYFVVSMICTWICLKTAKFMTLGFWKLDYDPDNYVIPYLTASIDVVGTVLLVASFSWLTSSGATNMAIDSSATTVATPSPS